MTATVVGAVYSVATGRLRRILVPDRDQELTAATHKGEAYLRITTSEYQGLASLQGAVDAVTGHAPSGDRVVAVDAMGIARFAGYIDPACGDTAPAGLSFVAHETAGFGWWYIAGRFFPPLSANLRKRFRHRRHREWMRVQR